MAWAGPPASSPAPSHTHTPNPHLRPPQRQPTTQLVPVPWKDLGQGPWWCGKLREVAPVNMYAWESGDEHKG